MGLKLSAPTPRSCNRRKNTVNLESDKGHKFGNPRMQKIVPQNFAQAYTNYYFCHRYQKRKSAAEKFHNGAKL